MNSFGVPDDITIIRPHHKKAAPTRVIWWETMDDRNICITGSEVGEVTFFDMSIGEEVASVCVSGCIDHLLLAHQPDHSTHLLVCTCGAIMCVCVWGCMCIDHLLLAHQPDHSTHLLVRM